MARYSITAATERNATHIGPNGLVMVHELATKTVVYGPNQPVTSLVGYTVYVKPTPTPPTITAQSIEQERITELNKGCTVNGVTYAITETAQPTWASLLVAVNNAIDLQQATNATPLSALSPIYDKDGNIVDGLTVLQFKQVMLLCTQRIGQINKAAADKIAALA